MAASYICCSFGSNVQAFTNDNNSCALILALFSALSSTNEQFQQLMKAHLEA